MAKKSKSSLLQRQTKDQARVVLSVLQDARFVNWYETRFVPECVEEASAAATKRAEEYMRHLLQQHAGCIAHP
jgi:hypothetical protein